MRPADLDRVMAINTASFQHPWSADLIRRELFHEWSTILLAVDEGAAGEVLGFIVFWVVHDEVHVLNVAVAEEHRRRGVARALMAEAALRGRARGARLVTLEVRRSNAPALALYRALGYRDVAVRPRYYAEEDEDAIVMELALA
ncbi:MAG TPA: ribosomal protein S18-alanine N-acetyltransferase [Anaeromyxobacteraceae bacterium]|nr:ribosomal protein S18-alanine N-acetyltransferase [Anaeromyxobacteraceae bacterium]